MKQNTDYYWLRWCNWSVLIYCVLGVVGFAVFARFWPPPAQDLTADQIGTLFKENSVMIKLGCVLMALGAPVYVVWSAAVSKIIGRIEGRMGPLATLELMGGLMTGLVTLAPAVIWLTAALRPETRSNEQIQMLYDLGWLAFDSTFVCSVIQNLAVSFAVLSDKRAKPLFPKWLAWLSFATAFSYTPLALMPFFNHGPFAWHGLISFWLVFVIFFVFTFAVMFLVFPALRRLEQEDG